MTEDIHQFFVIVAGGISHIMGSDPNLVHDPNLVQGDF